MSKLNHFAISAILHSEIAGESNFGHGQIASRGDAQRYFDMMGVNEPSSIRHENEKIDVDLVIESFLTVREAKGDRGSTDLYVADPARNRLFLTECRSRGIVASDYKINKTLFFARKNKLLPDLASTRTSIDYERQAFACEFAATELRYSAGASIDDILCDPELAAKYDAIATRIAPGFSSFEYRWPILSIRKAGRHLALPEKFKLPSFGGRFRLVSDPIGRVPTASGIYLLYEKQKLLYARSAVDLRRGVEVHRDPAVLGAVMPKLWRPQAENFIVDYAVLDGRKRFLQAVEKKVVEEFHPIFNVPRSAA